ncbi:MAG: hypothetical protein Q4D45_11815 [Lachnospiraceae bacterium]|nr:hypothetical protein [Lachnospiraceae bacterium]
MGYVEGLDFLSSDITWQRSGNFFYKTFKTKSGTALLLGCTHTFWGEIAGRIVAYLAEMGVKRIIYSGKLGTLNPDLIPNQSLATGNLSILPNGQVVIWKNLFENIHHKKIYHGVHITIPSVLQENINWALTQKETISFVDPEIGHMAYAAQTSGVEYSYLHIISDNLCRKYQYDLSNERENNVIAHRQILLKIIGQAIIEL